VRKLRAIDDQWSAVATVCEVQPAIAHHRFRRSAERFSPFHPSLCTTNTPSADYSHDFRIERMIAGRLSV